MNYRTNIAIENSTKSDYMKKLIMISFVIGSALLYACGGGTGKSAESSDPAKADHTTPDESTNKNENPSYDPERGQGKFTNVEVAATLDPAMAVAGEKVYSVKCSSCHKLTDEILVGPGWKGVTTRHKPEWIMNFVTNPDEMIDKDPKVQAMLELCLVRMPNQNLDDQSARNVYEYMRKNDGVK